MFDSRLDPLPRRRVLGREVPVALGARARLLGLAHLDRERAGPGLLIPRCSSVHTFGMRFALDLWFLDRDGEVLAFRPAVPARRLAAQRGAAAVLEAPAVLAGEPRDRDPCVFPAPSAIRRGEKRDPPAA